MCFSEIFIGATDFFGGRLFMNVYAITIITAVFLLLIYICDTKKFFKLISNPYLIIFLFGLAGRFLFINKPGYEGDMRCFESWAEHLFQHGFSGFYETDFLHD